MWPKYGVINIISIANVPCNSHQSTSSDLYFIQLDIGSLLSGASVLHRQVFIRLDSIQVCNFCWNYEINNQIPCIFDPESLRKLSCKTCDCRNTWKLG